jgi:hypothetical protein
VEPDRPTTEQGTEQAGGLVPRFLRAVAALATAVGFTSLAYADPESAVWPTLAFFSWAFVLSRAVIEWPAELGLVPRSGDDSPSEEDEFPDDRREVRFLDEDQDSADSDGRSG